MAGLETVGLLALVAAFPLPFRPAPPPLEMLVDFPFAGGLGLRGNLCNITR